MDIKNIRNALVGFSFSVMLGLSACQTTTTATETAESATSGEEEATEPKRLSPDRVDVRGFIIRDRYYQGQVTIEVEGTPSQYVRYNRAAVLVLPTTQIVGIGGKPAGLSDLRQGQVVSIVLRAGGRGNQEGVGVARKVWLEEPY